MQRLLRCLLAAFIATACGSQFNLPFSNANPLLPSSFSVDDKGVHAQAGGHGAPAAAHAPKNVGTQFWLVPVPGGDLQRLAQNPELWPRAASRVDVLALYQMQGFTYRGFQCGVSCGPNDYNSLMQAVPGGFFKWVTDHGFNLAFEGSSVKPYACTPEQIDKNAVAVTLNSLDHMTSSGGRVVAVSMDEPMLAGMGNDHDAPFPGAGDFCHLTAPQVAQLQKRYNDGVHARFPDVAIGFIEPYPFFTVDQIESNMLELEAAGVPIPYFHLDFDLERAVREHSDWRADLPRLRDFCQNKGIAYGTIITGPRGDSNGSFMTGALPEMTEAYISIGVTAHTVSQSWADNPTGGPKNVPNLVPEDQPGSHTWMVNQMIRFMNIQPAR